MEESKVTIRKIPDITTPQTLLEKRIEKVIKRPWSALTPNQKGRVLDRLLPLCSWCGLSQKNKPIRPTITTDTRILAIGRNPGKGDNDHGTLLSNPHAASQCWDKYLETLNTPHSKVTIANVCNCYVNRNIAPQPTEMKICREWLYLYLQTITIPEITLLMGNDATRAILGDNHPSVGRIYGDLYETSLNGHHTLLCPVQHPGFILRNPDEWQNTRRLLDEIRKIKESGDHEDNP